MTARVKAWVARSHLKVCSVFTMRGFTPKVCVALSQDSFLCGSFGTNSVCLIMPRKCGHVRLQSSSDFLWYATQGQICMKVWLKDSSVGNHALISNSPSLLKISHIPPLPLLIRMYIHMHAHAYVHLQISLCPFSVAHMYMCLG